MRIGIYFPGFPLYSGGQYTFEHELLSAFVEVCEESHHTFSLYYTEKWDLSTSPLPSTKKITTKLIDPNKSVPEPRKGLLQKIIRKYIKMDQVDQKTKLEIEFQKALKEDNIQFLWFPTPIYLRGEMPYIATSLDIQHRLQPWFPEFSQSARWNYLEQHYADYLRRAAYIIVPNQTGQDELSFFYRIPPERFRILPHPIARIKEMPTNAQIENVLLKFNLKTKYLFYPAQFWAHKNHANLLRAVRILNERHGIDLALVLAGSDRGNLSYILELADELQIRENVHYLGFISREDLLALYKGAFALTYMSYFGPENLPPLEAFSCGCPVIASDVAGAAEQLGDAAIRVDPSNPEKIAIAIKNVYENPLIRKSLVEKGYARSQGFSSLDYVRRVIATMDEFQSIRINWR